MTQVLAVARVALTEFRRQIPGLLLTYLAPVIMMSIFGLIFGGFGQNPDSSAVELLVVDEDNSEASHDLVSELSGLSALEVMTGQKAGTKDGEQAVPYDRTMAEQAVRQGTFGNALIIPPGFAEAAGDVSSSTNYRLLLMCDSSKPIEQGIVQGMLQRSMYTVFGRTRAVSGLDLMGRQFNLPNTQVKEMQSWLEQNMDRSGLGTAGDGDGGAAGGIGIEQRDVLGEQKSNPMLSHQVAAWLSIFILFTMAASGGSLLRERAAGTLRRVLQSPVAPRTLLAGKYLAFAAIAYSQVLVMYLAGSLILGVDILGKLGLLLFFGLLTAMAATSFGLVLAVLCRTQEELSGASTIVILAMGALGGSMFPSFLMPQSIRLIGKFTFNGWAMQGYQDIFWRDQNFIGILPESAVMFGIALVALAVAVVLFNQRFVQAS